MRFLTDFADQAVVLPLIVVVALVLAGLGWRRGAVAWLAAVGVTFGAVLTLKLVLFTCGPALHLATLRSPSGHTAAAAIIAGGIAVTLSPAKTGGRCDRPPQRPGDRRDARGSWLALNARGGRRRHAGRVGCARLRLAGRVTTHAAASLGIRIHRRGRVAAAWTTSECREPHPRGGFQPPVLRRRSDASIERSNAKGVPRLCRGGSRSLTFSGVVPGCPSTKLRIVSRQSTRIWSAHRWTS